MNKDNVISNEVDVLVSNALIALDEYKDYTQEKIDEIVAKVYGY